MFVIIMSIAPKTDAAMITTGERVAIRNIDPIYTSVPRQDGPFLDVSIRIPASAVIISPGMSISIRF